jgi:hypothetical protein
VVIISAAMIEDRGKDYTAAHRTLLMAPTSELHRLQSVPWLIVGVMQRGKHCIASSYIPKIENYSTGEQTVEVALYPIDMV